MENRSPDMLKPTLIAGAIFGTVAAFPFFNLINCACCALIVACGFVAAYLYSGDCRRQSSEFRPGMGAVVGLVAGLFYAMAHTIVHSIISLTVGDVATRTVLEWIRNLPDLPPEQARMIEQAMEQAGTLTVFGIVLTFFWTLLLAAVFSTVGGLIGGAVFKVPAQQASPPDPWQPPPPPQAPPPPPPPM